MGNYMICIIIGGCLIGFGLVIGAILHFIDSTTNKIINEDFYNLCCIGIVIGIAILIYGIANAPNHENIKIFKQNGEVIYYEQYRRYETHDDSIIIYTDNGQDIYYNIEKVEVIRNEDE